jgi:hypothetical protein
MKKELQLRYDMFVRVRDFGNAHRRQFPDGSMGGKAFRAVEAAIAEIDACNKVLARNEKGGKQARAAARAALVEALTEIASTARLMSKSSPGADDVFQVSDRLSDVTLLAKARSILDESQLAVDRLVLCGLPKTFVTDLQELIERFEQAIDGRRSKRSDVATAQEGIKTATARALDACRTLDIVVTITLKKDPVKVATWRRDRRINPKSRIVVPVVHPAVTVPETTPPEPPAAAPVRPALVVAPPSEEPIDVVPFDDTDRKAS